MFVAPDYSKGLENKIKNKRNRYGTYLVRLIRIWIQVLTEFVTYPDSDQNFDTDPDPGKNDRYGAESRQKIMQYHYQVLVPGKSKQFDKNA